jgi:tetratricopeptide (TPR) repeat protein
MTPCQLRGKAPLLFADIALELVFAVCGDSVHGLLRRTAVAKAIRSAVHTAVDLAIAEQVAEPQARDALRRLVIGAGPVAALVRSPQTGDDTTTLRHAVDQLLADREAVDAARATPLSRLGVDRGVLAAALERHIRAEIASRGEPGGVLEVLHDRLEAIYRHQAVLGAIHEVTNRTTQMSSWRPGGFALPRRIELVGRARDRHAIVDLVGRRTHGAPPIVVIHGMAGVGKTSLAIEMAQQISQSDGYDIPFVSLHGYATDSDGRPAPPADPHMLLGELLIACGMPGGSVAQSTDMRASMWRGEVKRYGFRTMVLDNARSADQVTALLPTNGDCVVLVTSRARLTELRAVEYHLHPIATTDLAETFAATRPDGERAAALRLAELTGGLALAYDIAREALGRYSELSMADIADELAELWAGRDDEGGSVLSQAVGRVWAAFAMSYQRLPDQQQLALCLLSRQPGYDLTAGNLAAMMSIPERKAKLLLSDLAAANLIQQSGSMWRFHDLIAVHVAKQAEERIDAELWRTALLRLLSHQADSAEATARTGADTWLLAERENLRHTVSVLGEHQDEAVLRPLLRMAAHVGVPLLRWGFTPDANFFLQFTVTTARSLNDDAFEAAGLVGLGKVGRMLDRYAEATERLQRAVELYRSSDDRDGLASALSELGHVARLAEKYDEALSHFDTARELYGELGNESGDAICLVGAGEIAALRGEIDESIALYRQAWDLFHRNEDRRGEAESLWGLAEAARLRGRWADALEKYASALKMYVETADRLGEADCLRGLGDLALAQHRFDDAAEYLESGSRLHHRIGDVVGEADALRSLSVVEALRGDADRARELRRQAHRLYVDIGSSKAATVAVDGDDEPPTRS